MYMRNRQGLKKVITNEDRIDSLAAQILVDHGYPYQHTVAYRYIHAQLVASDIDPHEATELMDSLTYAIYRSNGVDAIRALVLSLLNKPKLT